MRKLLLLMMIYFAITAPLFSGCKGCDQVDVQPDAKHDILILTSFSVPEAAWLSLSKEMEGKRAAFVVRGLPDNSFKELSKRVSSLKRKGLNATVLVDPRLFREYQVETAPTFLFFQDKSVHQVKGNIPLRSAEEIVRSGV